MKLIWPLLLIIKLSVSVTANEILGCGGFIKSHVQIDFSKVVLKLYNKQDVLKEQTNCAPNNGYYFIPVYDKGEYILKLEPPPGWSFSPTVISVIIDGKNDECSQGKDINFTFKGFGITGKVESFSDNNGPAGINVELKSKTEVRNTVTSTNGVFFFTPVYPGEYTVSISHTKWKLLKDSVSVKVTEGNTELPKSSLVVGGYDVSGFVKSEGEPIVGAKVGLVASSQGKKLNTEGCETLNSDSIFDKKNVHCYVTSNANGNFKFPSLPNGEYYLYPYYKGQKIHFEPQKIAFNVFHNSVELREHFEVVGFSINGRVLDSTNGKPMPNVAIILNGDIVDHTNEDGAYLLEKIKAGTYTLSASTTNYKFKPVVIKLHPSLGNLPDLIPDEYNICGSVIGDKIESVQIAITRRGSTEHLMGEVNLVTGEFCEFLRRGNYQMKVQLGMNDNSLQFFPMVHNIEVTNQPLSNIIFSQVKAVVSGKLECIKQEDCTNIRVFMRSEDNNDIEITSDVQNNSYSFNEVLPGTYKVYLSLNRLCWNKNEQLISISSSVINIPTFVQTGFLVKFISSHDTKLTFDDNKHIMIPKDISQHCLNRAGIFNFNLDGCHLYDENSITYKTDSDTNEIFLNAKKHFMSISIKSEKDYGEISVSVNIDENINIHGPLKFNNKLYTLELFLSPGEEVELIPQSENLYFDPPILSITGKEDCTNVGVQFEAFNGIVFQGKIVPPLQGVEISIESENFDTLIDESDNNGFYKFPPLDDSKTYKIIAKKESYVLVGPDNDGNFLAHKLAEVIVQVNDENDDSPLQGALLSLSGSESYRRNLITNGDGKIVFSGLSPSEYFLKPMMKEYIFEPTSKIIPVTVGASVNVILKGKRVAYSAYGQITSLNNQPEKKMTVIAKGLNNCSHITEEATSEVNGMFRVRGLLPHCSYNFKVKNSLEDNDAIERVSPSTILTHDVTSDINGLHMIVFRPPSNTDILLKIFTDKPEYYKNLVVKIYREATPDAVIHTVKIDSSNHKIQPEYNSGILVQLPYVPLDGKSYAVHLESNVANLNKGSAPTKYFTADGTFKYIDISFIVKSNVSDSNIKQTSKWTLIAIFIALLLLYNYEQILEIIKGKVPIDTLVDKSSSLWKPKQAPHEFITNLEIDQIVEDINWPKKKVKSKRI